MTSWCRKVLSERRRASAAQDGFTLIELVIVIVILPVLILGIAAALISILTTEATTFNRVADSADAQITSANFARDVQSSSSVTTNANSSTQPGVCTSSSQPPGSKQLLSLTWGLKTTPRTVTAAVAINQVTLITSTPQFTEADVGSLLADGASADIPKNTKIASFVNPNEVTMSNPAVNTNNSDSVTISTSASVVTYWDYPVTSGSSTTGELVRLFCIQTSGIKLSSSQIVAHDLPAPSNQSVATVTCAGTCPNPATTWIPTSEVTNVSLSDDESLSGYQFNLSAEPRYANLTGLPAVLLTGSGQALNLPDSNDVLSVTGGIQFNSSTARLAGLAGATLTATGSMTETQCVPTGNTCPQVTSIFGGVSTCNGVTPCAAVPTVAATAIPAVSPPVAPGTTGGCVTTTATTCQPGNYPSSPLLLGGAVTLASGNYSFAGPVSISAGSTVFFGSGQYTFNAGLNIQAGSTVVGDGVFFYMPASTLTVGSTGTNVRLSPMLTGPYAGLLVLQSPTDSSTMTLGAGHAANNSYGGEIEAAGATITVGTFADQMHVGSIVAGSVVLGGNVNATIG